LNPGDLPWRGEGLKRTDPDPTLGRGRVCKISLNWGGKRRGKLSLVNSGKLMERDGNGDQSKLHP